MLGAAAPSAAFPHPLTPQDVSMPTTLGRRVTGAVAAIATCAILSAPAATAQSVSFTTGGDEWAPCEQASPAELEQLVADVHEHTNRERAAVGAPPVERAPELDRLAGNWSARMATEDRMYHNPEVKAQVTALYPGRWRSYGENVLQNWCGVSGEALVRQWMNSTPHRVNLLNRAHTHLGVGVEVADSRKLYSTQNFVRLR